MDGYKQISQILFCKDDSKRLKPFEDDWVWTDAEGVTRHLTSMNSYHLWNLRRYIKEHMEMAYLLNLKSDLHAVIENISELLMLRDYDEKAFVEEDELYIKSDSKNSYDEEYVMYDGLWILGSGIDKNNKWWFEFEYANKE